MARPKLIIGGRRYRWEKSDNPNMDVGEVAQNVFGNNYYKPEGQNLEKYKGWLNENKGYVPVYEGEAYSMPQIQKEMAARQQAQNNNQSQPKAKDALDIVDVFRSNAQRFGLDQPDNYSIGQDQDFPQFQQAQAQTQAQRMQNDLQQDDNYYAQNDLLKKRRERKPNQDNFANAFLGAYNAAQGNDPVPALRQYRDYGY